MMQKCHFNSKNKSLKDLKEDPTLEAKLKKEFDTMEVQRCFKIDPATGEPNSFDFRIETVGVLPVATIVERALKNLEMKCAKYSAIDKDLPENLTVQNADARMKGFDFIFQKEDHTLGNLLQTYLDQNLMGRDVTFAGYKIPHPLRDEMVLRVGVNFPGEERDGLEMTARIAVAKAANSCAEMFRQWREEWMQVTARGFGRRNQASLALTAENARAQQQAADLAVQTAARTAAASRPASRPAGKRASAKV